MLTTENDGADIFVGKRAKNIDSEAYSSRKQRAPAIRGMVSKESKETLDSYQPQNVKSLHRAWDMLREINMHTKYYGNFLINGVDTVEEFLNLDEAMLKKLDIDEDDLDVIMKHAVKRRGETNMPLGINETGFNIEPLNESLHSILIEGGLPQENVFILESHGVKTISDMAKLTEKDLKKFKMDSKAIPEVMARVEMAKKLEQESAATLM